MKLNLQTHPESLSDGTPVFVSHCPELDVASQGKTEGEALANLCEALQFFLQDADEKELARRLATGPQKYEQL